MLHTYLPITLQDEKPLCPSTAAWKRLSSLSLTIHPISYLIHRRKKMKDATSLYRYVVKSQCRCQMSLCSVVALYAPLRDPGGSGGKVKKILPFAGIEPRHTPLQGNHFNKHPNSLLAVLVVVKQLPYLRRAKMWLLNSTCV